MFHHPWDVRGGHDFDAPTNALLGAYLGSLGLKSDAIFFMTEKGCGNPAGKPPGARHRATMAAEALLDGEVQALTRKAIERALEGDGVALRLCLERILPARKDRPVKFDLPPIKTASDISKALGAIAKSMAAGELTPDEAGTVATIMEAHRKAIETVELEERVRRLEAGRSP
jgi:hypothetical protein